MFSRNNNNNNTNINITVLCAKYITDVYVMSYYITK